MKKLFFIYFFFSFVFVFCQKISLKDIDASDSESVVKHLAKELKYKYKEKDIPTYYDNLFRISMINGEYDLALSQLDSVRNIYRAGNPDIASVMGSQYEIYIDALKKPASGKSFEKVYEEAFRNKYERLSLKSQLLLPQYFAFNEKSTDKDISEIFGKKIVDDSISIIDAVQLCRKYNNRTVAKKTFSHATFLIKKLDKEAFTVYDSLKISVKNNAVLSLSVVLNNKTTKPLATIFINTIYSDKSDINLAKEYASKGYACVISNTRGKYLSPDKVEPFEHEAEDIHEAISWITKQNWSNGKVGMIGGSYLGFSQWAATKKLHPALKTIIPQASVGIGTMDFPMNNNVFSPYVLRWLNYVTSTKMTDYAAFDEKKWNLIYKKWYESGKSFKQLDSLSGNKNEIFQRWIQHPSYDEYWQKMAPAGREYSQINIPVLTITGYYDSDQLGALYYLREHYKYNKKANHYLIIGPYDHSGAQGKIAAKLREYTIDKAANIDLSKICIEWFDYILKGEKKPQFIKDKINYQVMGTNQWKSTHSINDFDKHTAKLYLEKTNEKNLSLSASRNKTEGFSSLKVDFTDRSDADELLALKYDVVEKNLYRKNNLIFTTDFFENPFELSGNFSGKLKFSINKKDVDIYVHLYELMADGKYFLLSTYLGRASYSKDSSKRRLLTPNTKEELYIKNNEFVSRNIEKGSKLVLVVGINKSPMYQINYGTGKDVSEETIADAKEPFEIKLYNDSYIEVPISEK